MEIIWHVSFDPVPGGQLVPRVPKERIMNRLYEDNKIPRICFSNSIQNCINLMPGGGAALLGVQEMKKRGLAAPIYTYPMLYDSHEKYVWPPEKVKNYVYDAEILREYWVTKEVIIQPVLIRVTYFQWKMVDSINGSKVPYIYNLSYETLNEESKSFRKYFESTSLENVSNRTLLSAIGEELYLKELEVQSANKQ